MNRTAEGASGCTAVVEVTDDDEEDGSGVGVVGVAAPAVLRCVRGVREKRRTGLKPMVVAALVFGVGTAWGLAAELVASREFR